MVRAPQYELGTENTRTRERNLFFHVTLSTEAGRNIGHIETVCNADVICEVFKDVLQLFHRLDSDELRGSLRDRLRRPIDESALSIGHVVVNLRSRLPERLAQTFRRADIQQW